jgi:hypothetical protein
MSAVTRFFFRSPYTPDPTTWSVIEWWESRRLPYNLAVGMAGLISLCAIGLVSLLHGERLLPPWQPIVAYAVAANVCYSAGPLADLYIVKRWGTEYAPVGAALFRYGFVFSVGLTLLPLPLAVVAAIVKLLSLL